MLRIAKSKQVPPDGAAIVDNYRVLHFDELPILFVGTNKFSTWIIGSLVEEDDDRKVERYFHIPVTYQTFAAFLGGRVSYRDVITNAGMVYMVDKSARVNLSTHYVMEPSLVPSQYLPSTDSFCPSQEQIRPLNYVAKLQGRLADAQSANPADLRDVQVWLGNVIETAYDYFRNVLGRPVALMLPSTGGSFELNYGIRFEQDPQRVLFSHNPELYDAFAQKFISFCVNDLPLNLDAITAEERVGAASLSSPALQSLLDSFTEVYPQPDGALRALKTSLREASVYLGKISTTTASESYKQIALLNRTGFGRDLSEQVLGVVDDLYNSLPLDGTLDSTDVVQSDDETRDPPKYTIIVYSLNRDTRKGYARIRNQDATWSQPTIAIEGREPLRGTEYTASLHNDKEIDVLGYARRVNGKYKHITIKALAKTYPT